MPFLTLELSNNIIEKNNLNDLFSACHTLLVTHLPTTMQHCKSRAFICDSFYIGDDDSNNALIHMILKILPGRAEEVLQNVGKKLLELLSQHFAESLQKFNLQITLEIVEIQRYFKQENCN